jgi:hypothetical protein
MASLIAVTSPFAVWFVPPAIGSGQSSQTFFKIIRKYGNGRRTSGYPRLHFAWLLSWFREKTV